MIKINLLPQKRAKQRAAAGPAAASADVGTKAKTGETNFQPPIDPVLLAMTLGASFVARSFSGDKDQLVPLIEAGLNHNGFALIDVLSPCVTFNDHEGSTKSYAYTREHYEPAVHADFVPLEREITASYGPGETLPVVMQHLEMARSIHAQLQLPPAK